jgi:hypothetical protein
MCHSRIAPLFVIAALPLLLAVAATSSGAEFPPPYCSITSAQGDISMPWVVSYSSYETFAGTGCEPMSVAEAYIEKCASSIPTGYSGVTAGDNSKAFGTAHRIVPRGKLPDDFKDDCIPWTANIRYRLALGNGVGGGVFGTLQAILSMPDGNRTVTAPAGQLNAHTDTVLTGCMPAALVLSKRASFGSFLRAYVRLEISNQNETGDAYEALAIGDPLVTIDPSWANASLFKVEQEDQLHPGVWSEVDRSWMNEVRWTDATTGLLTQPGADVSASWGDFDDDGLPDVCIMNNVQSNVLLRNQGDGSFTDVTPPALAAAIGAVFAKWIDYDNDGRLDLYLIRSGSGGGGRNVLLRNEGGGAFTDVTPTSLQNYGYNRDAAWADYDLDGDLDVFLVSCYSGTRLMRQDADHGFTDVTPAVMVDTHCCQSAMWGDYDNDRRPDLYLVLSDGANRLFHNAAGGVFADVTAVSGPVGDPGASQSAVWTDYDNDGRLDLYVGNNGPNRLLHNLGGGVFADSTDAYTASASNDLTSVWADLDLDGNVDLVTQNSAQRGDVVFNLGDHQFDWALWHTSGPVEQFAGALSVVDLDADGDLDLYFNRPGNNTLLRNDQDLGNHWLEVDLRGDGAPGGSNRFGVGARVRIVTSSGLALEREITDSLGRFNGVPLRAHFGLGAATRVDSLEVRWPNGAVTRSAVAFTADRLVTVHESGVISGVWDDPHLVPRPVLFPNAPNPFNPVTFIRYELRAPADTRLTVFDVAGRVVRTLVAGLPQLAGRYEAPWDGRDDAGRACASGVYFYRLEAGGFTDSGKMALLR